jgi:hypothetical protein
VAGTCEYGKELSVSIKMRVISSLAAKTGQLLKKASLHGVSKYTTQPLHFFNKLPYWSMHVLIHISINLATLGRCNLLLQLSLIFYGCNVWNILCQGS